MQILRICLPRERYLEILVNTVIGALHIFEKNVNFMFLRKILPVLHWKEKRVTWKISKYEKSRSPYMYIFLCAQLTKNRTTFYNLKVNSPIVLASELYMCVLKHL